MEGNTPTAMRHHVINLHVKNLQQDIDDLLKDELNYAEKINELSTQVQVHKEAYMSVKRSERDLEDKLKALKQEFDNFKLSHENEIMVLKGSERRVICLIDGDGTIFSPDLLSQGQQGGHRAAKMLFQSVRQYFLSTFSLDVDQKNFWVHIFYNKRGLMDAIGHASYWAAKQGFDDFSLGFNQAAERFVMVDVGYGKEAADAKVKVMLDDFIRSPQTSKILFGGCHDNGYITSLRSAMTGGFKDKLVLLRGYKVSEAGIDQLGLPSMTIENLFLETKLNPSPHSLIPEQGLNSLSLAGDTAINGARPTGQLNYASVASTPKSDATGNTNDELTGHRASSKNRHVNPNIPLSKHNPPPCTLHYLANCKFGAGCKYGHNYLLEPEHYDTIRENAKKSPCPAINRDEECTYGDHCCYGHFCPLGTKCYFLAMGTCKFVGARMHKGTVAV